MRDRPGSARLGLACSVSPPGPRALVRFPLPVRPAGGRGGWAGPGPGRGPLTGERGLPAAVRAAPQRRPVPGVIRAGRSARVGGAEPALRREHPRPPLPWRAPAEDRRSPGRAPGPAAIRCGRGPCPAALPVHKAGNGARRRCRPRPRRSRPRPGCAAGRSCGLGRGRLRPRPPGGNAKLRPKRQPEGDAIVVPAGAAASVSSALGRRQHRPGVSPGGCSQQAGLPTVAQRSSHVGAGHACAARCVACPDGPQPGDRVKECNN